MPGPIIKIIRCGMLTTVQDRGRYGYQKYGVTVSGAMDAWSLKAANILIGNDENCAGLEITLLGPHIEFCRDTFISICGGNLGPLLDGDPLPMWQGIRVRSGQILSFSGRVSGCRAYLAVAGGISAPLVLGSRSTFLRGAMGGIGGRPLKDGDVLFGESSSPTAGLFRLDPGLVPFSGRREWELRVIPGPQVNSFTGEALDIFLNSQYTVSLNADRMGIRLEGRPLEHKEGADILSEAVCFGSVQVPAQGRPIIMMAECQTTGGYTKIAGVITVDHTLAAQCLPGDKVLFQAVRLESAHRLLMEREESFRRGLIKIND